MADTDAFGREQDEDPLAATGRPGTASRRRRVVPALVALLVSVGVLAAVALPSVLDPIDAVLDVLDDPDVEVTPPPSVRDDDVAEPPVGLDRRSLLRRGNLAPALRRLQARAGGGRVALLRLAPDRIDAQVITGAGRLRNLQARHDGTVQVVSDVSVGDAGPATFGWTRVDASAPRRIARQVLGGRPSRELDYLVLTAAGGGLRWLAYRTDNASFSARADGRAVRPLGA